MASMSLMEFIEQREAEIKELRKALYEELKQLKAAKAAISGISVRAESGDESSSAQAEPTIKEMTLEVISDAERALTAEEILQAIKSKFLKEIQRTSLSPQLTRLKREGRIVYDIETSQWGFPAKNSGSEGLDSDFDAERLEEPGDLL